MFWDKVRVSTQSFKQNINYMIEPLIKRAKTDYYHKSIIVSIRQVEFVQQLKLPALLRMQFGTPCL